ncbi:MAG: ROK family protein [Acidimicrobiia bacterium]|nr:ROK family protein [Acidimicrobiia bacterium]
MITPEPLTVGLDIGGTKILGVALTDDAEVVAEVRRDSPEGFGRVLDVSSEMISEIEREAGRALGAVGVGIAGLVDAEGALRYGPNVPDVVLAPVRAALAGRTGLPVVVDNDANVAAWGEAALGAAAGVDDMLLVTLGTGIGGGMVLGGRLYRGANGFSGEIGHFTVEREGPMCACGERGHWEAIASGSALGRMARDEVSAGRGARMLAAAEGGAAGVDGRSAVAAASEGDPEALALLRRYSENVALGLAGLANILDPERIVIAGGLVSMGDLLFVPLREAFSEHLEGVDYRPPIPIVPAVLGERAGAMGAALLARDLV